ncbi:unnamed protein product [Lathyrus oleraceus]|nr:uncharacterized protein LOC127086402 [Pisum sativum]
MAKKNKSKKNKKKNKKNVAEAPSVKPIPDSPPPPPAVSPERSAANQRLYDEMKNEAFDIATTAFERYYLDARVAEEIKTEFDRRFGPTWHCIIGSSYGSCVSCEAGYHFYLYFNKKDIILFKCGYT